MTSWRWDRVDRELLGRELPAALVVLPIGATEQHGRHLATGTDALLAGTVAQRSVELLARRVDDPIVLAPTLAFGASDHHLPFGGTLSLSQSTLLAVLVDLMSSVHRAGARRLVVVNGHGGNIGVCRAAAAQLAADTDLRVAHVDYWDVFPPDSDCPVPGHAGEFETSLVQAVSPELAGSPAPRSSPSQAPAPAGFAIHAARDWAGIDGYTDDPARADPAAGQRRLQLLVTALADRLEELVRTL